MVVSCETETRDGSNGSGALYVSGFDGSFPYILAGEFVCTRIEVTSYQKLPLLLLLHASGLIHLQTARAFWAGSAFITLGVAGAFGPDHYIHITYYSEDIGC